MAYIPPIKKRQYINPQFGNNGKVVAHACVKCSVEYPAKTSGVWFERADQRGVWCWVCPPCLAKRASVKAAIGRGEP